MTHPPNYEEVRRLADAIERRFAALDIVVNNAGVIRPRPWRSLVAKLQGSSRTITSARLSSAQSQPDWVWARRAGVRDGAAWAW